jgi:glycerol kinase
MKLDYRKDFQILRVDGGAASNSLLLEIQAQLAGLKVERPHNLETTSMGAILFAGLGAKLFSSIEQLKGSLAIHSSFEPALSKRSIELVQNQKKGWQRAIKAVRVFSGFDESLG